MGAIENEFGTLYCTGVVVSRNWILSALRHWASGFAEVVGVLSKGSNTCLGIDVYTRIDVNAGWLTETIT